MLHGRTLHPGLQTTALSERTTLFVIHDSLFSLCEQTSGDFSNMKQIIFWITDGFSSPRIGDTNYRVQACMSLFDNAPRLQHFEFGLPQAQQLAIGRAVFEMDESLIRNTRLVARAGHVPTANKRDHLILIVFYPQRE